MKILKDSFIYLIGELFAKSLPFLMLPYLTRKLGPEGFGELSYYLTMLSLFAIFIGLSQDGAVTRYFYFYGKKALNIVVKAGYLFNIATSFILLLVCWWFKAEIMAYVVLATMFQSFVNVQLALRQCQKKPFQYITIQIVLSLTNVLFTIAVLEYFSQELVALRILALVAANLITFLIATFVLGNLFKDSYHFTWKRLRSSLIYIITFGLPLILHQSSIFMKGQLDRIFIYQQYTKTELGVYSAGIQMAAVLPIVFMSLNKAIVPYYYQGLKDGLLTIEKIKKYTLYSFPLSIFPAVIGFFIPEKFYLWVLGQDYIGSKYYTVMYLFGYCFNLPYLIMINYFFFHGTNSLISKITLISAVIYVFFLFFFSKQEVEMIPYALILSNLILLLVLWKSIKYVK
ncbi:oligosaccharide flippase family protein [Acinetobacter baumannii]|uniref:oligosaccharide flippase family protein n=2 Tax=Acinetobacter baumannii TaxID=470 RepID=UPI0024B6889F|nr:oligosaccharide flippase family protein [Acinetobacter baumannii]MDI9664172.1 oligosaccharide flippase family protein [Acinetobacter baumannii]MDI9710760.1 oligosaccharide flippase family protein [Acinetobacter baumannii]